LKPDVKYPHTISLDVDDSHEINYIKPLASKPPNYTESEYWWPFDKNVVKLSSKEDLKNPLADTCEMRTKSCFATTSFASPFITKKLLPGEMVWVECTIVLKSRKVANIDWIIGDDCTTTMRDACMLYPTYRTYIGVI